MGKINPCSKTSSCRQAKKRSHNWEATRKSMPHITYDLYLNMHLIKDRSDTTVGKRSRKQKISCLRIKIPRSSKKDRIQGLGHCSPTVAAEEELVKRVDVVEVVEVDLPQTDP